MLYSTRRFTPLILLTVLSFTNAGLFAQDFKSPIAKLELQDGDTVVFLGDSITHQCLYTQYVEDYYFTRFPKLQLRFHNAGVGGARARDALDRFDRDVASYKPKYVTILLGMNDGSYLPYDDKTFQTYKADMTELIGKVREIGATPILMTPTMYDSRAARLRGGNSAASPPRLEFYNSTLAYYGAWLREVAGESGGGFVDMYSPLNNLTLAQRKIDSKFTMIKDAVHPDPPGQLVMAFAILDDLAAPRAVSNIRVTLRNGESPKIDATGGKAADARESDGGFEFSWTADSLPWVLPEDAATGVAMTRSGHRMSREALEVHGLAPGNYELTIDGQSAGVFPENRLAAHIELQENRQTPQFKQAAQVAELNKKRNETAVKPLRNEWSKMQQFYRLQRQAKNEPDKTDVAKKLDDQTKVVAGLEERIAQLEKTAGEIEQQIREARQPKSHQYQVARVELAAVKGRITFRGTPIDQCEIVFVGNQGREFRAKTGNAGQFVVRPGVIAGEYRVGISSDVLPASYGSANTSGLIVSVQKAGPNEFAFALSD